jgi:hypothetical protein
MAARAAAAQARLEPPALSVTILLPWYRQQLPNMGYVLINAAEPELLTRSLIALPAAPRTR